MFAYLRGLRNKTLRIMESYHRAGLGFTAHREYRNLIACLTR